MRKIRTSRNDLNRTKQSTFNENCIDAAAHFVVAQGYTTEKKRLIVDHNHGQFREIDSLMDNQISRDLQIHFENTISIEDVQVVFLSPEVGEKGESIIIFVDKRTFQVVTTLGIDQ